MRNISLVTFDVRGTLITFSRSVGEIYADVGKKFGFSVDPGIINVNFGKHFKEMRKQHPNFGLHSGLGWQKWWKSVITDSFGTTIAKKSQSPEHNKNIEHMCTYLIDRFATKDEWKLTEGSIDLLKHLEDKKIHMGVISNFDPRLHSVLDAMGIKKYLKFVIISYEAGFSKPDEKIFRAAEILYSTLGNKFDKTSTVHVGDSLRRDYYGAQKAGWHAVLISPTPEDVKCDSEAIIFRNLKEFKQNYLQA